LPLVLFESFAVFSQETLDSVNVILTGVKACSFGVGQSIARGQLPTRGAQGWRHFSQRAAPPIAGEGRLGRHRMPDGAAKESEAVTFL
jgi:hypothetical protein